MPNGTRSITIAAHQFAYEPGVVRVARGERVSLTLESRDVTHGLYLEGHDVNLVAMPGQPAHAEFVADRPGQYAFRCSQPCGHMHPFMNGRLVVEPDRSLPMAALLAVGLTLGAAAWATRTGPLAQVAQAASTRAATTARTPALDVAAVRWVRPLIRSRLPQFVVTSLALLGFALAISAGFLGSPVGSHNFATVFVWIAWWGLLMVALVPLGGRLWCAVCPLPAPGEWLQRLALFRSRTGPPLGLNIPWPRWLRTLWLQNLAFLGLAVFSVPILTRPAVTAAVLLGLMLLAVGTSLVFQRRAFCRYLCPVGGFIGLYSLLAPVEVRVKDREVCRGHQSKDCVAGNASGYGCPWLLYPGTLERNAYCGLCLECLRSCPKGNVALRLRPLGADLTVAHTDLGEAFKSLIMLTTAGLYTAIMAGPWGALKDWVGGSDPLRLGLYAVFLLWLCLLAVPALFLGATWWSARLAALRGSLTELFGTYSYSLIPLGLAAWAAFSLGFLFTNGSYVVMALGDPFGWGWDWLGRQQWQPYLGTLVPWVQASVVLGGLVGSVAVAYRIGLRLTGAAGPAMRALAPLAGLVLGAAIAFLWLFLG